MPSEVTPAPNTQPAPQATPNAQPVTADPTPAVPAPEVAPAAPPVVETTPTLTDVLEARKQALEGQQTPAEGEPVPAAEPEPQIPEPVTDPITSAKDALYQLAQEDPAKLAKLLQVSTDTPAVDPVTEPAPQADMAPEAYAQAVVQESRQLFQNRVPITAEGLFGAEVAEELGIQNQDFSSDLEQFIQATIAPIIGNMLNNAYQSRHDVTQQLAQMTPMVQQHQFTQSQQDLGNTLKQAFPALGQGNMQAIDYAEKRFQEMAPMLMPPDLMQNPQTNPQEYARIAEGIVRIAASEFANVPHEQTPVTTHPAPVLPEPQPVTPTYRNHLGHFQTSVPKTLDEFSAQRVKTLFPQQ